MQNYPLEMSFKIAGSLALQNCVKEAQPYLLEPVMIIVMGSIVGFIAMAIILPIFRMSSIVSG
jgi:type II secretory pathway component PulF